MLILLPLTVILETVQGGGLQVLIEERRGNFSVWWVTCFMVIFT